MVIFPLLNYLSDCSSLFSFIFFGSCSIDLATIELPALGVYDGGNLPICFIPIGRFVFPDCVLVFYPLIPPCP